MLLKDFREPVLTLFRVDVLEVLFVIEQIIVEVLDIEFWAM